MARSLNFDNPQLEHAINVIKKNYGDNVSVSVKSKDLLKFGRNTAVGTSEATVMTLAGSEVEETYVSGNDITHFASSASGDTSIEIVVEGHTISGSDLTFSTQTVTLNASNGQTKTALTTPLARITRAYNNNGTELTGNVYFAEDVTFTAGVPQTDSAVHLIIPAGQQQSRKCSTSISSTDYWIITTATFACLEKTSAFTSFVIESRVIGKVFRPISSDYSAASSGGTTIIKFDPYVIVPKNSDVRVQAVASASGTDVEASIQGYLAQIT